VHDSFFKDLCLRPLEGEESVPVADEAFGRRTGLTSQQGQGLLDCHHQDAKTSCDLLSLEWNPGAARQRSAAEIEVQCWAQVAPQVGRGEQIRLAVANESLNHGDCEPR
jgi:hypothetical protein